MSRITRRMFLGAALSFGAAAFWARPWLARPRVYLAGLRRRWNRWRTGMQPRWVECSSTTFYRHAVADDGSPMPHKIISSWRELRWPDNDDMVKREDLGLKRVMLCMDITYERAADVDFRGGVEWHPNELRVPGPKCANGTELADRVRHAAKYPFEAQEPGDEQTEEIIRRNRWISDAKATVEKWDRDPRFSSASDAKAFAELELEAIPVIARTRDIARRPDFEFMDFGIDDKG